MLNFGNKEFRNLQEQVLKNAQDIETLKGREDLQIVIVEELPEEGNPNYIYLVPNNDEEESNVYDEYIWLADSEEYEKIGGVDIDLTNYVTTDTEQTISGAKSFTAFTIFSNGLKTTKVQIGDSEYTNIALYGNTGSLYLQSNSGDIRVNSRIRPSTAVCDLGDSSYYWRDFYLSGKYYLGTDKYIYLDSSNRIVFSNNADRLKIDSSGNVWFVANAIPLVTNTYDLGSASNYWKDLYLTGNISNGLNTVSVANIASKTTSTYASGTFDSNGQSTIDISGGTPEGLFIFSYGNCQCFLRLTAAMIDSAVLAPISVACPMIYNSVVTSGWLSISSLGTTLLFTVKNDSNHVDSGYAWTLVKTNLI